MAGLLDAVLGYLGSLANPATQSQPAQPVPQQPQGSTSTSPAAAPSSGGFMQGASNFLGNPLTQAALSGYFNAIGQPKSLGPLAKVSAGGLGALQGFNTAEASQQKTAEEQLAMQKAQAELAASAQQQKVFGGLSPQQQQVASFPSLATFQEKAAIQEANKQSVAAFQAMHPQDPAAAAFSMPYSAMQTAVSPGDIEKDYQEHLTAPQKAKELTASIAEKEAQTQRLKNAPAAGTIANWYDPKTKQFYRGAQRSPTDVPASVATSAKSDQEMKARAAAWQKAYADAKRTYITTNTKTESHYFGPATKTPPSEADADAYAKQQADSQVNALYGTSGLPSSVGATAAASADEPSAAGDDPLSLIPEGGTPAMKGDVHGYVDADGTFHSVE